MKHLDIFVFCAFLTLFGTKSVAQNNAFMQRVSIEVGAGYNSPISPINEISRGDYAGFRNIYVGGNYKINELFGIRLTYGNISFKDKNESSNGLTLHKLMAEGTFNIIQSIEMEVNPFEVVAHAGIGVSGGKSTLNSGLDNMGTIQLGLMPIYRISNKINLLFDATYVINMRQNFVYNGEQGNIDSSPLTGEYLSLVIGLGFNF